jgi:hypothetical protein
MVPKEGFEPAQIFLLATPSPKRPLNVRARPKPSVSKLSNDLAAGVEMENVDSLPTEPVTDDPAYDEFLEGHKQPFRPGMRYIVSAYPTEGGLVIPDVDYTITLVKAHLTICTIELRLEGGAYLRLSPVGSTITWFVDRVIPEDCHNAVEIVDVEGIRELRDRVVDLCGSHVSSRRIKDPLLLIVPSASDR